jgi:hypothetical protein
VNQVTKCNLIHRQGLPADTTGDRRSTMVSGLPPRSQGGRSGGACLQPWARGANEFPQQTTLPKASPHKVSKTKQRPWGTPEQEKQTKTLGRKAAPLVHGPLKQRGSKHSIWHLAGRGLEHWTSCGAVQACSRLDCAQAQRLHLLTLNLRLCQESPATFCQRTQQALRLPATLCRNPTTLQKLCCNNCL